MPTTLNPTIFMQSPDVPDPSVGRRLEKSKSRKAKKSKSRKVEKYDESNISRKVEKSKSRKVHSPSAKSPDNSKSRKVEKSKSTFWLFDFLNCFPGLAAKSRCTAPECLSPLWEFPELLEFPKEFIHVYRRPLISLRNSLIFCAECWESLEFLKEFIICCQTIDFLKEFIDFLTRMLRILQEFMNIVRKATQFPKEFINFLPGILRILKIP